MTMQYRHWRPGACLLLLLALAACSDTGPGGASGQAPEVPPAGPQGQASAIAEPGAAAGASAAAATAAARTGEELAQPCLSCHSADNFAAMDAAELLVAIQGVKAGETTHLPLPDSLTNEDLARIAAFIAAANAREQSRDAADPGD